jgi:hypothetical protein
MLFSDNDLGYQICKMFLENSDVYERMGGKPLIARIQAIEFALIFLLRKCLEETQPWQRKLVTNVLEILEKPTPNTKKFWRLDPRKWV